MSRRPSFRRELALAVGGVLLYTTALMGVAGGLILRDTERVSVTADFLRGELEAVDATQASLHALAEEGLGLAPGDAEAARRLAVRIAQAPEGRSAVSRAGNLTDLSGDLRAAMSSLAEADTDLLVRLREHTASVELGGDRIDETRNAVFRARLESTGRTRDLEILALRDLAERERRLRATVRRSRWITIVGLGAGLLLFLGVVRLTSRRLMGPLGSLQRALKSVQGGELDVHVPVARPDELGELTELFNEMVASIRERGEADARLRDSIRAELQRSEFLFRSVVDHAEDVFLVLSRDGVVQFASPAWEKMGAEPDEPVGCGFAELVWTEDANAPRLALAASRGGEVATLRARVGTRGGDDKIVEFVVTTLEDQSGLILAAGRDVTLREAEETTRRSANRMQVVAQLTGGVAHDFNNLLTVIKANTDLMRHDAAGSSPELLRLIESVQSAAHRGEELTKSLLSFARRRAMREEVADLSADVSAIADLVRRTLPEGVRFAVEIPEERIPVRLDRTQLETAVMNVCLNARDAMDGAGELSISVATETLTEAEDDLAPGRYGVVRVRDTGPGMSPEVLSRAFEPFFTTKGVGQTGLGLAMVYGFAQQSKGSAQLESAPGGGTEVILYFPVQASGSEFGRVRLSEGLGTR